MFDLSHMAIVDRQRWHFNEVHGAQFFLFESCWDIRLRMCATHQFPMDHKIPTAPSFHFTRPFFVSYKITVIFSLFTKLNRWLDDEQANNNHFICSFFYLASVTHIHWLVLNASRLAKTHIASVALATAPPA
jgi:hypothetical protein